jgi:hypothetical protein
LRLRRRGAGVPTARLAAGTFGIKGYVLAMRAAMVMFIAVVALAAAGCLAITNKAAGGQDPATASGADLSQMAGTISSPGSSGSAGQSPGSSSGTAS